MRTLLLTLLVLPTLATAAEPASAPASAPTTAPAVEFLDDGRVRITPPAGWTFVGRTADGLSLRYKLGEGEGQGFMAIIVNPQTAVLKNESADQMAKLIGKQLRDAATHENAKI